MPKIARLSEKRSHVHTTGYCRIVQRDGDRWIVQSAEDSLVHRYPNDASAHHSKRAGCANGEINYTSLNERATVIYAAPN